MQAISSRRGGGCELHAAGTRRLPEEPVRSITRQYIASLNIAKTQLEQARDKAHVSGNYTVMGLVALTAVVLWITWESCGENPSPRDTGRDFGKAPAVAAPI